MSSTGVAPFSAIMHAPGPMSPPTKNACAGTALHSGGRFSGGPTQWSSCSFRLKVDIAVRSA